MNQTTDQREPGRFAFVIHPVHARQLLKHPVLGKLGKILPLGALERIAALTPDFVAGEINNVRGADGAIAEGWLFGLPVTGDLILQREPRRTYDRLVEISRRAADRGARILGLGAYTSVVGDAGVTVAEESPIPVTTGNSFTAAAALRTLDSAARSVGLESDDVPVTVVGATGSIGSALSRLFAEEGRDLNLCATDEGRLDALAGTLAGLSSGGEFATFTDTETACRDTRLVITATSSVEPVVDPRWLRPGSVVLDIAQPPDVDPEGAGERDDVLVVKSGEVELPEGSEITFDIGLPDRVVYACLAETVLLALEHRFGSYTLGRELDTGKIRTIGELAEKHGLKLAGLRDHSGAEVAERDLEHIRELNLPGSARRPA